MDEKVLKQLEKLGYRFEISFVLERIVIKETTCEFIFFGDTLEKAIGTILSELMKKPEEWNENK